MGRKTSEDKSDLGPQVPTAEFKPPPVSVGGGQQTSVISVFSLGASDGAELHQPSDGVLVQRVLAGRVVEAGLRGVAVAHGAAAVKHAGRRRHFLWRKEVVLEQRLLQGVAVVVCEGVSMDRQLVGGLVAA